MVREICRGDDGLYAFQGKRLGGIDRFDAGMGMGAAQDFPVQQARRGQICPEFGAACYLVDTIRAVMAMTNDFIGAVGRITIKRHASLLSSPQRRIERRG